MYMVGRLAFLLFLGFMMIRFHAYTENCYFSSKQTMSFSENQVTTLMLLQSWTK